MFSCMKCLNVYRMQNPRFPEESPFPYIDCACGKCYACLKNRREMWLFRLSNESVYWNNTYFLTLTYSDENCDGVLHREHLQKFFKRLRHRCSFKHYSIGEYGTHTFRPHYHSIIFTDSNLCDDDISSVWPFGLFQLAPAYDSALNYVLHYHVRPKEPLPNLKTFFVCSKGLGMSFMFNSDGSVKPQIAAMLSNSQRRIVSDFMGRTYVLPRYYIKKAEDSGISVMPSVFNGVSRSRFEECFKVMYPDAVFSTDGRCLNYPDDLVVECVFSVLYKRQKKLQSYNYQNEI